MKEKSIKLFCIPYVRLKKRRKKVKWLSCVHIDCSLAGSSAHGISQARILECGVGGWGAGVVQYKVEDNFNRYQGT